MTDNVLISSFAVAFCWSLVPIIYKIILTNLPAKTVFLLYYITTTTLMIFYTFLNWNNINLHIDKINYKIIVQLLIVVLLGSLIANYLYYDILEKNDTYLVTILTAISPLLTILIAYFYLGEKINLIKW